MKSLSYSYWTQKKFVVNRYIYMDVIEVVYGMMFRVRHADPMQSVHFVYLKNSAIDGLG